MANELSDKALEEIRREVIEGRNLVIKTDNQLKTLHAELKLVGKRQEDFQRRQWISSAVAYAVFAGLCVAGAIAISNARTASAGADRERFEKQVKELTAQIDQLKAADVTLATNERTANDVYKMMSQGQGDERLKGIDALAKTDQSKLSPFARLVLSDRATLLRKEVGAAFLDRGKAAFRRQDYPSTVTELTRFMAMNPVEEDAVEASYFLGNALIQTRKADEAVPHLQRFVAGDKRAKNRDYAMLMLVQALDASGQRDKAAETAREAIATYPSSEFGGSFRSRLSRKADPAPAPAGAPEAAPAPAAAPRQPLKPTN
jgi:TolA-binding protein